LNFIQCFGTAGWVTGTASGPQILVPIVIKGSVSQQEESESQWGKQVKPKFIWKMVADKDGGIVVNSQKNF